MSSTTSDQWEKYGIGAAYQGPPIAAAKPFPLVMFSPGWTLPAFMNLYIPIRVASHGFIVAVLNHYGDGVWPWEPWDHLALATMNRPLDVSFALSDLLTRNQTIGDPLENSINRTQIAASGHSIGGYATMELASGIDSVCNNVEPNLWPDGPLPQMWLPVPPETCVSLPPDKRIRAIVPIDGSNQMLLFQELARIKVPSTGIGEEWSILGGDGWQARQHAAMQGTPNYRVDVNNAFHTTFTNACEAGYVLRDIGFFSDADLEGWQGAYCNAPLSSATVENLATKYLVAFLKTQLVGVQGYQSMLTPGRALTSEQNIEFFVTERRNPNAIDVNNPPLFIYFPHQPGSAQAQAEKNPKHPRAIRPVRIVH